MAYATDLKSVVRKNMRVRISPPALDTRRILIYQEHLIRPKRWRPRTTFRTRWKRGASILITLPVEIQEGNKAWSSLSLHTSNVHYVKATK